MITTFGRTDNSPPQDGHAYWVTPPSRKRSKRIPLADRTYQLLVDQFMSGQHPPGKPLNIDAIARDLEISATPVREALARLEHTGLVEREPLRGYRVAALLTEREITQLMELRLLLEPALAAHAAREATKGFTTEILATIDTMHQASTDIPSGTSLRRCWASDEAFHRLITRQAGNKFAQRAYEALGGQLQRFRLLADANTSQSIAATDEHRQIYTAIIEHDPKAASEHMKGHIINATQRMLSVSG